MTTIISDQQLSHRTMLDRARDALGARMTKDNLRLVLENVVTYAAELESRLAEYERPVDEDPIAYKLTEQADGITRRLAPVQALREDQWRQGYEAAIEVMRQEKLPMSVGLLEAQLELDKLDGLVPALTVYRAQHDSIVMGHYTTRDAAMGHVHATLANEEGNDVTARVIWRADDPQADDPTWECWLFDTDMDDDSPTGYVVTPLEVAAAYDAEADE